MGTSNRPAFLLAIVAALALCGCTRSDETGEYVSAINEQLLLLATLVGAIAALPSLIEFLVERRKRKERLALSIEEIEVSALDPHVAGLDRVLEEIADLIDRARNPKDYERIRAGNEILILAGNLSGKKALARAIARKAELGRLIIVYNPRNVDALAKARSLIRRYRHSRVMLLLDALDTAFSCDGDDDITAELDALIETTSSSPNVLVVGTALRLVPNSPLDNAFGVKLVLPGTPRKPVQRTETAPDVAEEQRQFLTAVIEHYHREVAAAGFALERLTPESLTARLLEMAGSPADVRDILALCETLAIHRHKRLGVPGLVITPEMLETAIRRVVTGMVLGEGSGPEPGRPYAMAHVESLRGQR